MPEPIRYRMQGDLQWQYTERREQAAHADEVQRLQRVADWMIVTPELLNAIEAGEHGNKFWLAAPGVEAAFAGTYGWRQGRNPHGFDTEGGARWGASEITHVLPFTAPALPNV